MDTHGYGAYYWKVSYTLISYRQLCDVAILVTIIVIRITIAFLTTGYDWADI